MTSADASTVHDDGPPLQDIARANLYAIIGRLFYGAPDDFLLAAITQDQSEDPMEQGALGASWRELREACRTAFPVVLRQEFDNLFIGVGKSEITPYLSHYVKEAASGQHLVRLRERLRGWGLARRDAAGETEDHVSGVCDVMRYLVSEGYPVEDQKLFFNEFVFASMPDFCAAINRSPNASFYRCVAQFTAAFLTLEKAAFDF